MRPGCRVRPVSNRAAPGPAEPLILAAPRFDTALTAAVAALFAVAADRGALSHTRVWTIPGCG